MTMKKALYVTGACLTRNTSANLSHNGFVQGLLEAGYDLDIIMADESWGEEDRALPRWEQAHYYEFRAASFSDRLRKAYKTAENHSAAGGGTRRETEVTAGRGRLSFQQRLRQTVKTLFYIIFPKDPVYPLERVWLKNACRFKSGQLYDLVVSNSSPAAGHKLVSELKRRRQIRCKRWVQIWEDPWFFDLYGGHSERIRQEEAALLRAAGEVYYVSPVTLYYQKQYFPESAEKMKSIPLPYFAFGNENKESPSGSKKSYGYFGDYFSQTRNLLPFYEALLDSGRSGSIIGDSDLRLDGTAQIRVSGRITLDLLEPIQDAADVLVHLCNLRGGQIPGKIYHYSATAKPILFILDGTEEEKKMIREYFGPYNRYYFCENDAEEIRKCMERIERDDRTFSPVEAFSPVRVIDRIITKEQARL